MNELTILNVKVGQDAEGRYCLNDCHKASGSHKKDGPSYWLATKESNKLISEFEKETTEKSAVKGPTGIPVSPLNTINDGLNNGTYACKELVYAYAMWINPAFHLKVIRAFDAMVTGEIKPPQYAIPKTYAAALIEAGRLAEENEAHKATIVHQKALIDVAAPKAAGFDKMASLEGVHNLRVSAQQCGWPERIFIHKLIEHGWLYKHHITGRNLAYSDKVKAGLMDVKNIEVNRSGYTEGIGQPLITQKGLAKLKLLLGEYKPKRDLELN